MRPKLYKYGILAVVLGMTGCSSPVETNSGTITGTRQLWNSEQHNYDYYCENSTLKVEGSPVIEVNGVRIKGENLETVKVNPGDTVSLEYAGSQNSYNILCIPKQLTGFRNENSSVAYKQPFPILGTLYAEPVDALYVPRGYRYIMDTKGTYLWYAETVVGQETDVFTDYTKVGEKLVSVSFSLEQVREKYILPDLLPTYVALSPDMFVVVGYERVRAKLAADNRPVPSIRGDKSQNAGDKTSCAPKDIQSIEYATRARLLTINTKGDILNVVKVEDSLGWMFSGFTFLDSSCSLGMDSISSLALQGEDTLILTPRSYPWGVVALNIATGKVAWKLDGNDSISLGSPPEYWTSAPAYANITEEYLLVYDNAYSRGESRAIVLPITGGRVGPLLEESRVATKLQCGDSACISVYGGSVVSYEGVENLLITTGMVIRTTEYMAGETLYVPGQIALVRSGSETWRATIDDYSVMVAVPLTDEDIKNLQ